MNSEEPGDTTVYDRETDQLRTSRSLGTDFRVEESLREGPGRRD